MDSLKCRLLKRRKPAKSRRHHASPRFRSIHTEDYNVGPIQFYTNILGPLLTEIMQASLTRQSELYLFRGNGLGLSGRGGGPHQVVPRGLVGKAP